MKISVIMEASQVPLGAKVTKRTGEKIYTIRDRLRVFGEKGERREIIAKGGTRFFVNDEGDANVISGTTTVVWVTDSDTLVRWLTRTRPEDNEFSLENDDEDPA